MGSDASNPPSKIVYVYQEMLLTLVDVFQHVAEQDNIQINLERIFDLILSFRDYTAVWIYHQPEESEPAQLIAHKGVARETVDPGRNAELRAAVMDHVFRTAQPISLKRLEPCFGPAAGTVIRTHLAVPLRLPGRVWGVLNVAAGNHRRVSRHEIQFFSVIAGVISSLLNLDRCRRRQAGDLSRMSGLGLQKLMEKLADGVMLMTDDFHLTLLNPSGKVFLGGLSEFEKGAFFDKFSEVQGAICDRLGRQGQELMEIELPLADPYGKVIRLVATPLHDPVSGFQGAIIVAKDITGEKKMARQERLQTRVSSVGSLIEGISHELNNPLAAVSGYVQMLGRKLADDEGARDILGKIDRELTRAIVIVKNLVASAERRPLEKVPVRLNALLERLAAELRPMIHTLGVTLNLNMEPDLPELYLERENIAQVFRTLIELAAQTLAQDHGGGVLDIAMLKRLEMVQVVITDGSPGVVPSNMPEVRAPVQAPDQPLEDASVRLAFCFNVVRNHGGVIFTEAETGKGIGYVIELPVFAEEYWRTDSGP
ncbi:MAG TPA: histidine kinase dimerization/phospho-acceptor domain-containing protein [Acidobacteriota bacterium]|nr:histidine kinase dimerization/phospho-acceptor domain-containing protein [Acidobacteriota bacterium]HNU01932.1 histidine kinase dimerization/phospho-acceptor domain-containing protein [Acidobacteriota bacterium]